jgi:hypothetical protein
MPTKFLKMFLPAKGQQGRRALPFWAALRILPSLKYICLFVSGRSFFLHYIAKSMCSRAGLNAGQRISRLFHRISTRIV